MNQNISDEDNNNIQDSQIPYSDQLKAVANDNNVSQSTIVVQVTEEEEESIAKQEEDDGDELSQPGFLECQTVENYEFLNQIGQGSYGVVSRALDKRTNEIVALKRVKLSKELVREGFPTSSLREISILLQLKHENIVNVREVVIGSDLNKIFVVMDYMDHTLRDLNEFRPRPFSISEVKCLMLQILHGIKYLHNHWVIHRDLKTSNILMDNKGNLKLCDFGMARKYGSPLQPYSPVVVTLWYRAPELLLGATTYSPAIDMWSVGCIFAELLTKEPLFPGEGEIDQVRRIFQELGIPNEKRWKGYNSLPAVQRFRFSGPPTSSLYKRFQSDNNNSLLSRVGLDLLTRMLEYDPELRITAEEAIDHPYFSEAPLPKSRRMMPTFPTDIHETGNRKKRKMEQQQQQQHEQQQQQQYAPPAGEDDGQQQLQYIKHRRII